MCFSCAYIPLMVHNCLPVDKYNQLLLPLSLARKSSRLNLNVLILTRIVLSYINICTILRHPVLKISNFYIRNVDNYPFSFKFLFQFYLLQLLEISAKQCHLLLSPCGCLLSCLAPETCHYEKHLFSNPHLGGFFPIITPFSVLFLFSNVLEIPICIRMKVPSSSSFKTLLSKLNRNRFNSYSLILAHAYELSYHQFAVLHGQSYFELSQEAITLLSHQVSLTPIISHFRYTASSCLVLHPELSH